MRSSYLLSSILCNLKLFADTALELGEVAYTAPEVGRERRDHIGVVPPRTLEGAHSLVLGIGDLDQVGRCIWIDLRGVRRCCAVVRTGERWDHIRVATVERDVQP